MAAALMDDLVEEILLRFPTDDPASLVRAALVCKGWHRLIYDSDFGRRFREFHRTPPLLGFICNQEHYDLCIVNAANHHYVSCFVPISMCPFRGRFVPKPYYCSQRIVERNPCGWEAIDSRHGRVLLHSLPRSTIMKMIVWDPITNEHQELPKLPPDREQYRWRWNAAVHCAMGSDCNHLDCHRGPFCVVFIGHSSTKGMFTRVYSSESGTWCELAPAKHIHDCCLRTEPSVLMGNALYFKISGRIILKYDLSSRDMRQIQVPARISSPEFVVTMSEDFCLGLAVMEGSKLYLWSKEHSPTDGDDRWAPSRVLELKTLLPAYALAASPSACGFVESLGVIILRTDSGFFTVNLKSDQVKKIRYDRKEGGHVDSVVPYISFYTPHLRYNSS
ncbi:hypothetical protein EJB05_14076, partial [Eragrostis curvula]